MTSELRKTLELSIPADEVTAATEKVVAGIQKKVRLPGFRPGKAPAAMLQRRFQDDIRRDVLKELVPKHLWKRAEAEGLTIVGSPDISDVHFQPGEPLRFKAEFETAPTFELKEYKDLTVQYSDPEVSEEDVQSRLEEIRENKAEYVNVDPRPLADGDYAVVALESVAGLEGQPIKKDESVVHIGTDESLPEFSENLRGMSPGEQKEFDVRYPEDYNEPRLSGKTIRFRAQLKGIRRRELPEMNDEFAQDLGDYLNVEEVREAVRKSLFSERQFFAQQEAQHKLVEQLIDLHDFPVPEAYIEHQIEMNLARQLAAEGVDPRKVQIDWDKVSEEAKTAHRARALREVKASLILGKIAERENLYTTKDEVDREIQRIARQEREPVAATRARLEKDGTASRIAGRIRSDKTLNFLFEHARKVAS